MDKVNISALILLGIMLIFMGTSVWNDTAIMDELAHIPAAYSYVYLQDMRLNPEHPPLIKDIAGFPLLFLRPNFPIHEKAWQEDVNGQWDMGRIFLYEAGSDPDKILRFSRFFMMLTALLLGWLFFSWSRARFGSKTALLALSFFIFSPTIIAHSRYVTTDIAATLGFFIGITTFINFLEIQTRKSLIIAGIAFGIAQLLKFSLFLLVPLYFGLTLIWILVSHQEHLIGLETKKRVLHQIKYGLRLFQKVVAIGIIGLLVIAAVYQFHVWNYPPARQVRDTELLLSSFGIRPLADITVWMAGNPFTQGLAQYFLGLLMVVQRTSGGNTTYFLGEVSATGWWYYFPIVYLIKETLAMHILTLFALFLALQKVIKSKKRTLEDMRRWVREHFIVFGSLTFIIFYWIYSMQGNLNIGVRHVLPTFPFIYLLVAKEMAEWIRGEMIASPQTFFGTLRMIFRLYIKPIPKYMLVSIMLIWMASSTITAWPGYLSYFNEIALGAENGYLWVVDSNLDWGQDLKRLESWRKENKIEKLALDYFGGGSPQYYLKGYESWWSAKGKPPTNSYFAISATFLQSAHGTPAPGFMQKPEDSYEWLRSLTPIARAGDSIFIYQIP